MKLKIAHSTDGVFYPRSDLTVGLIAPFPVVVESYTTDGGARQVVRLAYSPSCKAAWPCRGEMLSNQGFEMMLIACDAVSTSFDCIRLEEVVDGDSVDAEFVAAKVLLGRAMETMKRQDDRLGQVQ